MPDRLRRLLAPRSVVVVGGRAAEVVVRQCRAIGYDGDIWPVHPVREQIGGIRCFTDLSQLPGVPDAAFVSVSREATVEVVAGLARIGAGGAVCHASGFAEDGDYGAALQRDLVDAAGEMALVGPNCLGLINYLDGAALWPEQHGGVRVETGVAVIAQSGNIAENLTMQRRSLPIAQVVAIGNSAVTGTVELIDGMLADPRVTAIGLYLEELPDVAELSRVAIEALRRRVPVVALKAGSSELGARVTLSHTSSLAGSDALVSAVFERLGIARVHDVETFLETLKFFHVHGALSDGRLASASCSGGEAAHVADLAQARGLSLPDFPEQTRDQLRAVLGTRVSVRNPLDYHTYIWGDPVALTECFTAFLGADADCHLLMLDVPRVDRCDTAEFDATIAAFEAGQRRTGARACIVASLPENMPESLGSRLVSAGIAPMQGVASCLDAVLAARQVGAAQSTVDEIRPLAPVAAAVPEPVTQLDEEQAKAMLASYGLVVPRSRVAASPEEAAAAGAEIGFPVVLKALSSALAHKSEVGGVRVGLESAGAVQRAAVEMSAVSDRFLVEQLVEEASVELIVGVQRDPLLGLAVTVGAGGVLVEVIQDATTILLPATVADVRAALERLRIWPLLQGFRGLTVDLDGALRAIEAVVAFATDFADRLVELEVNPLLVGTDGAVAVDALIRLSEADALREGAAS